MRLLPAACLLLLCPALVNAAPQNLAVAAEIAKLGPLTGATYMGGTVSISGDTVLIGAMLSGTGALSASGKAYVFVRTGAGWTQQAELLAFDAGPADQFGASVSISGDTAVVGASGKGSAYVFTRTGSTWSLEAQLFPQAPNSSTTSFGEAVDLDGDAVIIGASRENHSGVSSAGAAYIFVRSGSTWSEEWRMILTNPLSDDFFGARAALSGETALVGSYTADHSGVTGAGVTYVFVRTGTEWTQQAKLLALDPGISDWFGYAVSVDGDRALIGARTNAGGGPARSGSAYIFERTGTTWSQAHQLRASDAGFDDLFGTAVHLVGDTAAVGAVNHDSLSGPETGSAYIFEESGGSWYQRLQLFPSGAVGPTSLFNTGSFGIAVAIDQQTVAVGATVDYTNQVPLANGAVRVFQVEEALNFCTAGTSASGCQASITAKGLASASIPSGFVLEAYDVPGLRNGIFFFGTSGRQANPWGNGSSFQCVVPPVTRVRTMTGEGTAGLCDNSFSHDLNAHWCPTCPKPAKNPGAGALLQAQLWYRDPGNTSNQTTSLSNAVEFLVGL